MSITTMLTTTFLAVLAACVSRVSAADCYVARSNPDCIFFAPGGVNTITCFGAASGRTVASLAPVPTGFTIIDGLCGKTFDLVGWRNTLRKMLQDLGTLSADEIEERLKKLQGDECGLPYLTDTLCPQGVGD